MNEPLMFYSKSTQTHLSIFHSQWIHTNTVTPPDDNSPLRKVNHHVIIAQFVSGDCFGATRIVKPRVSGGAPLDIVCILVILVAQCQSVCYKQWLTQRCRRRQPIWTGNDHRCANSHKTTEGSSSLCAIAKQVTTTVVDGRRIRVQVWIRATTETRKGASSQWITQMRSCTRSESTLSSCSPVSGERYLFGTISSVVISNNESVDVVAAEWEQRKDKKK